MGAFFPNRPLNRRDTWLVSGVRLESADHAPRDSSATGMRSSRRWPHVEETQPGPEELAQQVALVRLRGALPRRARGASPHRTQASRSAPRRAGRRGSSPRYGARWGRSGALGGPEASMRTTTAPSRWGSLVGADGYVRPGDDRDPLGQSAALVHAGPLDEVVAHGREDQGQHQDHGQPPPVAVVGRPVAATGRGRRPTG